MIIRTMLLVSFTFASIVFAAGTGTVGPSFLSERSAVAEELVRAANKFQDQRDLENGIQKVTYRVLSLSETKVTIERTSQPICATVVTFRSNGSILLNTSCAE